MGLGDDPVKEEYFRSRFGLELSKRFPPNKKPMMKCGHRAYGKDPILGTPLCMICDGMKPEASQLAEEILITGTLVGRNAKCEKCGRLEPSSYDLPYFNMRLMEDYDEFSCECKTIEA